MLFIFILQKQKENFLLNLTGFFPHALDYGPLMDVHQSEHIASFGHVGSSQPNVAVASVYKPFVLCAKNFSNSNWKLLNTHHQAVQVVREASAWIFAFLFG